VELFEGVGAWVGQPWFDDVERYRVSIVIDIEKPIRAFLKKRVYLTGFFNGYGERFN